MSKLADIAREPPAEGHLAIPRDSRPNRYWTDSMREMAHHIGAYATLQIVDRFGGLQLYVPIDPQKCAAYDLIGADKTAILCGIYNTESINVPVAASAIRYAKSQPVLAAVRSGSLSLSDAVMTLRRGGIKTSRTYLCGLLSATDQGIGVDPWQPKRIPDARQMVMFDLDDEHAKVAA
jgi:hypothetical protein